MKICLITFRSVTPAQRGESALVAKGIPCTLQRTPRWMQEQGCGYSLRLPRENIPEAVSVLKSRKIQYRKIYCGAEQGKWEEMEV